MLTPLIDAAAVAVVDNGTVILDIVETEDYTVLDDDDDDDDEKNDVCCLFHLTMHASCVVSNSSHLVDSFFLPSRSTE
jgi:hypothetical protein